jgi:hypothetical protein
MHFHLPKPLHGWREFAGEVGIIVIGVLIALGAEQLLADWHWRNEVRETDRRLRAEMAYDLSNAYERFAIAPCLRPRLAELRDQLLNAGTRWPGSRATFAKDLYNSGFPSVYRTPNRPWLSASWQTTQNGEVFGHLGSERVQQFSTLYDEVGNLRQSQAEEVEAASSLGDLAFAGPISPAERRENLKTVARLDALDALILFESQVLLDDARKAGIAPDPTATREGLEQQREYRGACVKPPPLHSI